MLPWGAAAQTRADTVLDRAVAVHGRVGTLRATFEQVLTNPLTGTSVTARGELQQRPPRLLNVTFTEPRGDRIVADGQSLWLYVPSAMPGQAMRLPLAEAGRAAPGLGGVDVLSQFLERPRARFTVVPIGPATVDGRPSYALRLVPRGGTAGAATPAAFTEATLWCDDASGYVRQFETVNEQGVVRRIRFTAFRPGAAPDDGAFRFVLPKGVRLVEPPGGP